MKNALLIGVSTILFFSCGYSKSRIIKKVSLDYENHQQDYLKMVANAQLLHEINIKNIFCYSKTKGDVGVVFDNNQNSLYGYLKSNVSEKYLPLLSESISLMSKNDVSLVGHSDSTMFFELDGLPLTLSDEIYIYYSTEKVPSFQEFRIDSLLASDLEMHWAYKLKDDWYLVVIKKSI